MDSVRVLGALFVNTGVSHHPWSGTVVHIVEQVSLASRFRLCIRDRGFLAVSIFFRKVWFTARISLRFLLRPWFVDVCTFLIFFY